MATLYLLSLLVVLIVYMGYEAAAHRRRWRKIPVRIHVNGTRGKSSTTRLIAAGLRSTGRQVLAKTTGTLARVILPNGRELPLFRPLGANIREQFRVVQLATELRADALVIECMALQPELQWLSERWFVNATHGVLTNCRPDHLEVMGPGHEDVARALSGATPRGGILFTGEQAHLSIVANAAQDRNSELVAVGEDDLAKITPDDLSGFRHHEHPQNVALALAVCERLGANRQAALEAMWSSAPDTGAKFVMRLSFFGRDILFVNGFAANDPESSTELWRDAIENHGHQRTRIALINCRADRPERSRQLGQAVADWPDVDQVIAMGTGTAMFVRAANGRGFDGTRLRVAEGLPARDMLERVLSNSRDGPILVVGLCNIGGEGLKLLELIQNRSTLVNSTGATI